jgi:hypothetical protein
VFEGALGLLMAPRCSAMGFRTLFSMCCWIPRLAAMVVGWMVSIMGV